MYSKIITLASLALTPISMIVIISDSAIVQAQRCPFDRWVCKIITGPGGPQVGPIKPADLIAKLEDKIRQGQAKPIDYPVVAYFHAQVGNTSMAETRLNQGLVLAKKAGDLEGQAIATRVLGEVLVTTGRRQEAASRLTEARNLYRKLGDQQSVRELDQQLIRIRRPN